MKERLRALLFLRRIGPYHHARFSAATPLVELTVVETRPASQEYPWDKEEWSGYRCIPFLKGKNPEQGLRGSLLKEQIFNAFEYSKPQVIITTGWADPEYHAVILESHRRSIPRVVVSDSRFEDEPRSYLKERLKELIIRSFSGGLVAGKASRNYLMKLGMTPDSIFQPWDVVDNNYFSTNSLNERQVTFSQRYFICISRFIEKKNIFRLMTAYADYKRAGGLRKLCLLGSGELEEQIKGHRDFLQLQGDVLFEGFVQYPQLPAYFAQSFCLILPSISDQWGLVVNEAMASGLPVLVSNACGCSGDLVEEGVNGHIFDPNSEAEMMEAMRKMDGKSEDEWIRMGQSSQEIISAWKPSDFASALVKVCEHAILHKASYVITPIHRILAR